MCVKSHNFEAVHYLVISLSIMQRWLDCWSLEPCDWCIHPKLLVQQENIHLGFDVLLASYHTERFECRRSSLNLDQGVLWHIGHNQSCLVPTMRLGPYINSKLQDCCYPLRFSASLIVPWKPVTLNLWVTPKNLQAEKLYRVTVFPVFSKAPIVSKMTNKLTIIVVNWFI